MKNIILILLLFFCTNIFAQQCPIIPLPNNIEALPGRFILNSNTPLILKKAKLEKEANYLQQELLKTNGVTLSIQSNSKLPSISLILSHTNGKATLLLCLMGSGTISKRVAPDPINLNLLCSA